MLHDCSISTSRFYSRYDGHDPQLLVDILQSLRRNNPSSRPRGAERPCIFLAGDSSLDNKFWFGGTQPATNGYELLLNPPVCKPDICYWLNYYCNQQQLDVFALNTAIEASSLDQRACGLLSQDRLLRDHISERDYLVVCVGGNDAILAPKLFTLLNILFLSYLVPTSCLRNCSCALPSPLLGLGCSQYLLDPGCFDCGALACATSSACAWPPGLGFLVDTFRNRVERYVRRLLSALKRKTGKRPRKVVVCSYYFVDRNTDTPSWADCALGCCLRYNTAPEHLQAAMTQIFRLATSRVRISGVEVVPFAMSDVLDGTIASDYVARVEPSASGGKKIAEALVRLLVEKDAEGLTPGSVGGRELGAGAVGGGGGLMMAPEQERFGLTAEEVAGEEGEAHIPIAYGSVAQAEDTGDPGAREGEIFGTRT